ncbi:hypothetical protein [Klebsiella quasipneumoniae]|uniref:hypothetical protein n=1 Tax=Klebsiella quasipneumoniae TaxID=1463165 RepID=UPI00128C3DCF|nr:hypothetical protein [Klebsiella quasipneumoniae]QFU67616.1 hypothetical protein EQH50_23760 [Klebsiella quasipneumoniae]
METQPNWLIRHINLITAAVALYPWLLLILVLWDNQRHHQNGYAALGAAVAVLFLLAVSSGINLLISSLVIFIARSSSSPLASGATARFFAMNSISLLWLGLLAIWP